MRPGQGCGGDGNLSGVLSGGGELRLQPGDSGHIVLLLGGKLCELGHEDGASPMGFGGTTTFAQGSK